MSSATASGSNSRGSDSRHAGAGRAHLPALVAQGHRQQLGEVVLVIDDEHSRRGAVGALELLRLDGVRGHGGSLSAVRVGLVCVCCALPVSDHRTHGAATGGQQRRHSAAWQRGQPAAPQGLDRSDVEISRERPTVPTELTARRGHTKARAGSSSSHASARPDWLRGVSPHMPSWHLAPLTLCLIPSCAACPATPAEPAWPTCVGGIPRAGSLPAEEILPPLAPFGQSPQTAGLDGVRWQAIPWLIGR